MKNTATPPQASEDLDHAPSSASTATCSAVPPTSARAAPTAPTSASSPPGPPRRASSRSALTYRLLRGYAALLSNRGAAPRTMARKLASARAFFRSMVEHGDMTANPPTCCPRPSAAAGAAHDQAAGRRRAAGPRCPPRHRSSMRDRALFELAHACELCAEELVSLDAAVGRLRRRGDPARDTRPVPAGEQALAAINVYLERGRPALAGTESDPALFLSKSGRRLSTLRRPAPRAVVGTAGGGPGILGRDPRDARPRVHLHDPGLHSGRVRSPARGLSAQSSAGVTGEPSGHQRQSPRAQRTVAALQGGAVRACP